LHDSRLVLGSVSAKYPAADFAGAFKAQELSCTHGNVVKVGGLTHSNQAKGPKTSANRAKIRYPSQFLTLDLGAPNEHGGFDSRLKSRLGSGSNLRTIFPQVRVRGKGRSEGVIASSWQGVNYNRRESAVISACAPAWLRASGRRSLRSTFPSDHPARSLDEARFDCRADDPTINFVFRRRRSFVNMVDFKTNQRAKTITNEGHERYKKSALGSFGEKRVFFRRPSQNFASISRVFGGFLRAKPTQEKQK